MSTLEAIILAIVQGVTEFFPLSSSGHILLGQTLFGCCEANLFYSVLLNLATMFAIIVGLFPKIKALFVSDRVRLMQIIVALLPLFLILPFLSPIKAVMANTRYLGYSFIATAVLLFVGEIVGNQRSKSASRMAPWRDALVIGLFQACAVMPGLSRLGATLSAARLLGWGRVEATVFSFLLSVPTAIGAIGVETASLAHGGHEVIKLPWSQYALGFILAFGIGSFSLRVILRFARNHSYLPFAVYCLVVGVISIIYFSIKL